MQIFFVPCYSIPYRQSRRRSPSSRRRRHQSATARARVSRAAARVSPSVARVSPTAARRRRAPATELYTSSRPRWRRLDWRRRLSSGMTRANRAAVAPVVELRRLTSSKPPSTASSASPSSRPPPSRRLPAATSPPRSGAASYSRRARLSAARWRRWPRLLPPRYPHRRRPPPPSQRRRLDLNIQRPRPRLIRNTTHSHRRRRHPVHRHAGNQRRRQAGDVTGDRVDGPAQQRRRWCGEDKLAGVGEDELAGGEGKRGERNELTTRGFGMTECHGTKKIHTLVVYSESSVN